MTQEKIRRLELAVRDARAVARARVDNAADAAWSRTCAEAEAMLASGKPTLAQFIVRAAERPGIEHRSAVVPLHKMSGEKMVWYFTNPRSTHMKPFRLLSATPPPVHLKPPPTPPLDPDAGARFIVNAGKLRRGELINLGSDDDQDTDGKDRNPTKLAPGQLILNAIRKREQEGK